MPHASTDALRQAPRRWAYLGPLAAGRPSSRAGVNAGPAWERAQGNGGQVRRDTPDRVPDPEGASRENR